MTNVLIFITIIAAFAGCARGQEDMPTTLQSMKKTDEEKKTFLALGDSYTIGESVAVDERWSEQFDLVSLFIGVNN